MCRLREEICFLCLKFGFFLQPTHIVILCQNAGMKCRVMSCRPMHEILSADISAGDIFRHNEVTNPCQNKWVQ